VRSDVRKFELVVERDLAATLAALGEAGTRPFAGGTDLMVLLAAGKLAQARFVSLWHLRELRGIEESSRAITLGALTTYSDVRAHATLRAEFPMMCQAARETGGVAIQNRGTLGGNIANASPAADSPPALLAYGAELELVSARGSRWVPYEGFHTAYKKTIMAPGEIVARVRLPRRFGRRVDQYRKVGPRRAQAISKVSFAACADIEDGKIVDVRIALGGVAPIVPRCVAVEKVLREDGVGVDALARARSALSATIAPIDDVRSTARYRRKVAENLLVDFVLKLRHDVGARA
jgi:CO/xanthine dehydrogenase FAD-binding subunit